MVSTGDAKSNPLVNEISTYRTYVPNRYPIIRIQLHFEAKVPLAKLRETMRKPESIRLISIFLLFVDAIHKPSHLGGDVLRRDKVLNLRSGLVSQPRH